MKYLKNYIFFVILFMACSKYPAEQLEYYDNGIVKTRIVILNNLGKKDVLHYFPTGNLSHEYNWSDSLKNGFYKSYHENGQLKEDYVLSKGKFSDEAVKYYKTGETQSKAVFDDDQFISSVSYDKNGILYNKLIGNKNEVLYQYYKDTSVYEIIHTTRVYSEQGFLANVKEDSAFYYSNNGNLLLKINNYGNRVKVNTYAESEKIILQQHSISSKYELDSLKKWLIGSDSLNLFYQFITED
ncbi:MAG: hypothetical protein RIG77_11040 [Cyclobacteriaceae bacterium]